MSVKTIVIPSWLAASIESRSRILPPGWTIAIIPASAAVLTESSKGKKPSLAKIAPLLLSPACSNASLTDLSGAHTNCSAIARHNYRI